MKKLIWLAAAAGLASYLYKRYGNSREFNRVKDAANDAYNKVSHHLNGVERKTESILS